jgi:hypothetical protein
MSARTVPAVSTIAAARIARVFRMIVAPFGSECADVFP